MTRDILKNLIELVPNSDIDALYKAIIKFVPKDNVKSDFLNKHDDKSNPVKITLPCKVGSDVYAIIERQLYLCRIEGYIIDSGNTSTVYLSYKQSINGKEEKKYYYLYIFKFGKTWFTDYDEAQHAFHLLQNRR